MDDSRPRDTTIPDRDSYFRGDAARLAAVDPSTLVIPKSETVSGPVAPTQLVAVAPAASPAPQPVAISPAALAPAPIVQSAVPVVASTPVVPAPAPIVATPTPAPTPIAVTFPPEPVAPPAPVTPQYSQLTPVYAPEPVNSPADIQQPAVKNIEFVGAPTPIAPAPVVPVLPPAVEESLIAPAPVFVPPTPSRIVSEPVLQPAFTPAPVAPAPSQFEQALALPPDEPVLASQPLSVPQSASYLGIASTLPTTSFGTSENHTFDRLKKPLIIAAIAVLLIGGGVFAATKIFGGTNTQQATQTETPAPSEETPAVGATDPEPTPEEETPAPTPTPEPEEETPVVPTAPTPGKTPSVANTGISDSDTAGQPRNIRIPALNVSASFENVGLTSNGAIGAPTNIWNAGWYTRSAQPGQTGAVFVDGHASANRNGLFGNLQNLRAGDSITVQRNDGQEISYSVSKVEVVDRRDVDVAKTLRPYGSAKKGLNIMSCTGTWIESEQTLTHRVLVYAVQK